MCISTAYEHTEQGPVLAEMIAMVLQEDGNVVMTNIMGKDTVVHGALKSADLTRGVLIIEPT